jgi:hypothetical protein
MHGDAYKVLALFRQALTAKAVMKRKASRGSKRKSKTRQKKEEHSAPLSESLFVRPLCSLFLEQLREEVCVSC